MSFKLARILGIKARTCQRFGGELLISTSGAPYSLFSRSFSGNMSLETTQTISYVTISDVGKARKLARSLVENRLAACVNIVNNVESIYEWQGKIEEESECMLIVKSDSSKTIQLTQFVEQNHPYDCPEVVTIKIDSGSKKYLDWVSETVSKPTHTEEVK